MAWWQGEGYHGQHYDSWWRHEDWADDQQSDGWHRHEWHDDRWRDSADAWQSQGQRHDDGRYHDQWHDDRHEQWNTWQSDEHSAWHEWHGRDDPWDTWEDEKAEEGSTSQQTPEAGQFTEEASWENCRRQSGGDATTDTPRAVSEGDSAEVSPSSKRDRKPKTGKEVVPSWDGESSTFRDYKRRVSLFLATTGIDPEFRGGRLVEQLTGAAWRATETLDMSTLRQEGGVDTLLSHLREELEPIEHLQVFSTLSNFFKSFRCSKGQEFVDFDTQFRVQCQKLEEVGAGLSGLIKSYWFLETASLSDELRKQVITAANGSYQYEKLRLALMAIVPRVRREQGESQSSTSSADHKKSNHFRGKFYGQKNQKQNAHGVNVVEDATDHDLEQIQEEPDSEDSGSTPQADDDAQSQIMMTQAAKKRATVEKSRGYTTKPKENEKADDRNKRIAAMKANMACSACRANGRVVYGHWHQDPECPFYGSKDGGKKGAEIFCVQTDEEDDSDDEIFTPDVNTIMMTYAGHHGPEKMKKIDMALSDTCCSRTVAGAPWVASCLRRLWKNQIMFYVVRENQAFRFGPGPKKWSQAAVVIPTSLHNDTMRAYLRISVVEDDVPLLVSHRALTDLGAVLNLPKQCIEMKSLEVMLPSISTLGGHVGFPIWNDTMMHDFLGDEEYVRQLCCHEDVEVMLVENPRTEGHREVTCEKHIERKHVTRQPQRPQHMSGVRVSCKRVSWSEPLIEQVVEFDGEACSSWIGRQVEPPGIREIHDGRIDGAKDKDGAGGVNCAALQSEQTRLGRPRSGEIEGDLESGEASQGSLDACRLEEDGPSGAQGSLRGTGGPLLRQTIGSTLGPHEEGTARDRARDVRGRSKGRDGRPRRRDRGPQRPAKVSHMRHPHDHSGEPVDQRSILRMPSLSILQEHPAVQVRQSSNQGSSGRDAASGDVGAKEEERGKGRGQEECGSSESEEKSSRFGWISTGIRRIMGASAVGSRAGFGWTGSEVQREHQPLPGGSEPHHGDAPSRRSPVSLPSESGSPLPKLKPDEVAERIKKGNEKRKYLKKGVIRRAWHNLHAVLMAVCLMTAASVGSASSRVACHVAANRPDCLEIFSGSAEVSYQFSRWGWNTLEPIDQIYGTDLTVEANRERIIHWIEKFRPRLVVVAYPCKVWSNINNLSCTTPQARRRLRVRRLKERPFLEFCEKVFEVQLKNGDDALGENPKLSASFHEKPIKNILNHPSVHTATGHGCRFGIRHAESKKLLLKPTLWFSTSPEICDQLGLVCKNKEHPGDHEHDVCLGGSRITEHAGRYTKKIA